MSCFAAIVVGRKISLIGAHRDSDKHALTSSDMQEDKESCPAVDHIKFAHSQPWLPIQMPRALSSSSTTSSQTFGGASLRGHISAKT
mmetsp:Transcript_48444/g.115183  ORF Transcript_48444/g.115183 Transcript_48444/m.115183 type:complete len:87 (+) Transcript_48444:58-318(+)